MDYLAAEADLLHEMYDFFEEFDFELLPDQLQYRRQTEEGFQNVIFSFAQQGKAVSLEVNMGTRIDRIEQLVQPYLQTLQAYKAQSNTVITSAGRLQNTPYKRFQIWKGKDISKVAQSLQLLMADLGFGFLDSVSKDYQVHHLFNQTPTKPCRYIYNQFYRCFKGLVAAYLVQPDQVNALLPIYQQNLLTLGAPDAYQAQFDALAKQLTAIQG